MNSKEQLVITLKSDLCVGSGYSYAGIVDSDVCYDECGLPYIPAKRLKGCLREAAGMIGLSKEQTSRLFGEGGQKNASGVFLGNAYMEGYESLYEELKHIEKAMKGYLTPQNVLDQFTTIKAQTKIMENGVAKDNSLRYIRTVNHYSPLDREQELCFKADVYYEDLGEDDRIVFENTVKALRNIGLNRSRGLGSVKCGLERTASDPSQETEIGSDTITEEDIYVLSYSVKNLSPLVLSANQENATEKYIGGQRVLGYFANAYLKDGGSAESAEFEELFLKNEVIFGGLYPCGGADGTNERDIYYPAPSYINRLKKTEKYVNVSKEIPTTIAECKEKGIDEKYARGEGNQPKKLKKKFVCFKEEKILVKEVASDIVYHHTKKSTKQGAENGELLYAFEVVSKGQCFAGTITGKGKHIGKLAGLLRRGNLQFGKSRSSQYGRCVLNGVPRIDPQIKDKKSVPETFSAGERVLVILQSDGIFMDHTGYTVRYEQVREQIKKALGITESSDHESETYSEIEAKMLTGYYSVWNLKRPAIPAVCAGSAFEFLLGEELPIPEDPIYVGERIGEGYGRLAIVPNDGKNCCIEEGEEKETEQKLNHAKPICKRILFHEMRERLGRCAVSSKIEVGNPAMLGRITLMLTDSINKNPNDPDEAYKDFCSRIESIKNKKTQEKAAKIKDDFICKGNDLSTGLKYVSKIEDLKKAYEEQILHKGKADESDKEEFDKFDNELKKLWSGYLMDVFVQEKYNQKSKEQNKRSIESSGSK